MRHDAPSDLIECECDLCGLQHGSQVPCAVAIEQAKRAGACLSQWVIELNKVQTQAQTTGRSMPEKGSSPAQDQLTLALPGPRQGSSIPEERTAFPRQAMENSMAAPNVKDIWNNESPFPSLREAKGTHSPSPPQESSYADAASRSGWSDNEPELPEVACSKVNPDVWPQEWYNVKRYHLGQYRLKTFPEKRDCGECGESHPQSICAIASMSYEFWVHKLSPNPEARCTNVACEEKEGHTEAECGLGEWRDHRHNPKLPARYRRFTRPSHKHARWQPLRLCFYEPKKFERLETDPELPEQFRVTGLPFGLVRKTVPNINVALKRVVKFVKAQRKLHGPINDDGLNVVEQAREDSGQESAFIPWEPFRGELEFDLCRESSVVLHSNPEAAGSSIIDRGCLNVMPITDWHAKAQFNDWTKTMQTATAPDVLEDYYEWLTDCLGSISRLPPAELEASRHEGYLHSLPELRKAVDTLCEALGSLEQMLEVFHAEMDLNQFAFHVDYIKEIFFAYERKLVSIWDPLYLDEGIRGEGFVHKDWHKTRSNLMPGRHPTFTHLRMLAWPEAFEDWRIRKQVALEDLDV